MRTSKKEQISDTLKPIVSDLIKNSREKYNYSLEDLSNAIGNKKNRQTLHKYETGKLNIPYDILFEICRVFNIDSEFFKDVNITEEEKNILEKKLIKDYVNSLRKEKTPVILVLNKVDLVDNKEKLQANIESYKNHFNFSGGITISAEFGYSVDSLLEMIISRLSVGPMYYPEDQVLDLPERFVVAEIIREKKK